jgi:hypothetical protein
MFRIQCSSTLQSQIEHIWEIDRMIIKSGRFSVSGGNFRVFLYSHSINFDDMVNLRCGGKTESEYVQFMYTLHHDQR